jgi:hypothetical protein
MNSGIPAYGNKGLKLFCLRIAIIQPTPFHNCRCSVLILDPPGKTPRCQFHRNGRKPWDHLFLEVLRAGTSFLVDFFLFV